MSATFRVGQLVRFARQPEWVERLPPESKRVFDFCLGRTFKIVDLEPDGLYVLDVSPDIDHRFGGTLNDIRLEAQYLDAC